MLASSLARSRYHKSFAVAKITIACRVRRSVHRHTSGSLVAVFLTVVSMLHLASAQLFTAIERNKL